MANQFLIKNTMADMRNLSASEIASLQGTNPTYAGVELLGYYEKGDTPAPILYYLSDTIATDDGGSIIEVEGIQLKHEFKRKIDAKYYGYKTDFNEGTGTDNLSVLSRVYSACLLSKCIMVIPNGNSMITKFGRFNDVDIEGYGANVYLKYAATPTLVQIGSNSRVEGIKFYSLEDMSYNRAGVEQAENVYLFKCGFYNFLHSVPAPNAWGLYLKNATNVIIDSCDFNNNTQSDLALVDNCKNINIINPSNVDQSGVYLNIEPNGNLINNGISIIGGVYRRVTILGNTFTTDPIQSCTFNGAVINSLRYKGANAIFNNTVVYNIENALSEFLGDLHIKLVMGDNLLKDPYLYDVHINDVKKSWISGVGAFRVDRQGKDYTTINFENTSQTSSITTSNYITGTSSDVFLIAINGRGNYLSGSNQISRNVDIRCYNDENILVSTIEMSCFRFPNLTGGNTGFKNQSTFFRLPQGATKFKPFLGNVGTSTKSFDVRFISINKVSQLGEGIDVSEYISANLPKGRFKISSPNETAGFGSISAKFGDILETYNPVVNGIFSWIVTAEGRPATFTPLNTLTLESTALKRGSTEQRPLASEVPVNYVYYNTDFTRHEFNTGGSSPQFVSGSPNATTSLKGLVNQAPASTNSATPPSETYTQAEVQAILTELRDLKSKLRTAGILAT